MPFTSPLDVHLANLERRDVLSLQPVPCPLSFENGQAKPGVFVKAFREIDAQLIAAAAQFRAEHDVAEVADRLADLKVRQPQLVGLIEFNTELLDALRGDPRPLLATRLSASQTDAFWKLVIHDWVEAHRAQAMDEAEGGEVLRFGRAA